MSQNLTLKRDEALESLRELESQHRQIAVDIERHVGRITTLNELIEETTPAPTEEPGEPGDPGITT